MAEDKSKDTSLTTETGTKLKDVAANWGLPGIPAGLAVHFFLAGSTGKAAVAAATALGLALAIKFFRRLEPSINKLFDWIIKHVENGVLQLWWLVTADFKRKYYQQLIFQCCDYRTQGLKTKGPFPLDLEEVFVPLKIAPESVGQISSDMLQKKAAVNDLLIWDLLTNEQKNTYKRLAILGPPGSGKSTLLEHVVLAYARNQQRRYHSKACRLVPILIYLRDIRDAVSKSDAPDLPTLLEQQPEIKKLNPNGWFTSQLEHGKCLVMLDGLDEVADSDRRNQVSQWVRKQIRAFPRSYFVVTSRLFGYRDTPLDEVSTTLEVRPFTLAQIKAFIRNWYFQNELMRCLGKADYRVRQTASKQAHDLIRRIVNQPALSKLALNPLLLSMIAAVHCHHGSLPEKRVDLYEEICEVLLGRRQDAKGISKLLTAAQKQSILQSLAFELMKSETREFNLSVGISFISEKLQVISHQITISEFLKDIENQSGLLVEREQGSYEFTHKSFQEYLAAAEIKKQQQVGLLVNEMGNEWWAETTRLYSAQSDATPFIQQAINSNNISVLSLALDCLEENLSIETSIQEKFEQRLLNELGSQDTSIFTLAAETRLTRRLSKLLTIDDNIAIDNSYITCAEYQLFINEQRQQSRNYQPEHWPSHHFKWDIATQPITGIKANDAKAFCTWLSTRTNQSYRLPHLHEVQSHYIERDNNNVATWIVVEHTNEFLLSGIPQEQQQLWQSNIQTSLEIFLKEDFARTLKTSLAHGLAHGLARSFALGRALGRAPDLDYCLDRARAFSPNRVRFLERIRTHDRDLDQDRVRVLNRARALERIHNYNRDLTNALGFDCAVSLDRALDFELDFEILGAYVSLYLLLWDELINIYEAASQQSRFSFLTRSNKQEYQAIKKCHENFKKVLDIYIFFIIIRLRQAGKLPAWESIQIVREET